MVVLRRPIDANEPDFAVNHVIVLAANRAAAISTYPCTGAPWRGLPTGLQVAATREGTGPPQVAHHKIGAQGAIGRSRRVGSVLRAYQCTVRTARRKVQWALPQTNQQAPSS